MTSITIFTVKHLNKKISSWSSFLKELAEENLVPATEQELLDFNAGIHCEGKIIVTVEKMVGYQKMARDGYKGVWPIDADFGFDENTCFLCKQKEN